LIAECDKIKRKIEDSPTPLNNPLYQRPYFEEAGAFFKIPVITIRG
jgi:hypothetical protein